jgi:hypothetical protein
MRRRATNERLSDNYRKALEIDPSLEAARDNLKPLGETPEH